MYPQTRRCERGSRCQRQKSGRRKEAEAGRASTTLRKTCPLAPGYVQDPSRASPARTSTRTRPGTTLEKALTRALTGSTLSVGRVFPCIFNAARPVGTIFNGHCYTVLFLDPSRGPAVDVGQPGVVSTVLGWLAAGRVLGLWSGTPSLNSVQRNSQALHVGRFLRACAALGIPAGEHSPYESALWKRPLRFRLIQSWSFSHVDFCAGGGRFRKTHCFVIHSLRHAIMSFSAMCGLPDQHWRNSRQNELSSLVAIMPQRIVVFVSDCLRQSVMNITVSRLSSLVSSCLDSGSTITHISWDGGVTYLFARGQCEQQRIPKLSVLKTSCHPKHVHTCLGLLHQRHGWLCSCFCTPWPAKPRSFVYWRTYSFARGEGAQQRIPKQSVLKNSCHPQHFL